MNSALLRLSVRYFSLYICRRVRELRDLAKSGREISVSSSWKYRVASSAQLLSTVQVKQNLKQQDI